MTHNRPLQHNSTAKWLHWTMALLILLAWAAVEYRQNFTVQRSPESSTALQVHVLAGFSIAALIFPRLIWRLTHRQPIPPPRSKAEHALANLAHLALYAFMIAMPITGYLGTGRSTDVFGLFTIPRFDETPLFQTWVVEGLAMDFEQWEKPIDFMHKNIGGEIILPVLLTLHIGAALFHHFWRKDDVLIRMLPAGNTDEATDVGEDQIAT